MKKIIPLLLAGFVLIGASACSQSKEDALAEYKEEGKSISADLSTEMGELATDAGNYDSEGVGENADDVLDLLDELEDNEPPSEYPDLVAAHDAMISDLRQAMNMTKTGVENADMAIVAEGTALLNDSVPSIEAFATLIANPS